MYESMISLVDVQQIKASSASIWLCVRLDGFVMKPQIYNMEDMLVKFYFAGVCFFVVWLHELKLNELINT